MAKAEPVRPQLRYANFDEMMDDVESMASNGYTSHGKWTLGQACGHVADWMRFPMDGFPKPPWFIRIAFWMMNVTGMAKKMANKIKAEGFKPGLATAPDTVPDADFPDDEGIAKLRTMVDRLREHTGELHRSPLFGEMDVATHTQVSLLHAQHHFSFLAPKA